MTWRFFGATKRAVDPGRSLLRFGEARLLGMLFPLADFEFEFSQVMVELKF
jgi:hypothetical protein